jgi:hypothetical protein
MGSRAVERFPAWLLCAAGAAWVAKAGMILATGVQPPFLLQAGQVACALAVLLLFGGFPTPVRRFVRVGRLTAGVALAAALAAAVMEIVPGAPISTGETFEFPYSALVLAGAAGVFLAVLLFGIAFRRGEPRIWASGVPLLAGLAPVPAAAAIILHAEAPVLLVGLAWAAAGAAIIIQGPPPRTRRPALP